LSVKMKGGEVCSWLSRCQAIRSEKYGGPKMSKLAACDLIDFGVMEFWRLRLTERYLRWLGNGAVSAHECTKAD
jgi:hypothetical protein